MCTNDVGNIPKAQIFSSQIHICETPSFYFQNFECDNNVFEILEFVSYIRCIFKHYLSNNENNYNVFNIGAILGLFTKP